MNTSLKKRKLKKEIPLDQIEQIFGDDYSFFKKIKENVFCSHCTRDHITTIANYQAFILANLDLLLQGKCKKCDHNVARVLEIGEVEKYRLVIESILERLN